MRKLVLLALLAGCGEEVNVAVNCVTTAKPDVECEVEQTKGTTEVEACWDFQIKCGNGVIVKAPRSCEKIAHGRKAKVVIPGGALTGLDKCEGDKPVATLSNMTIDGKPSQVK